MKKKLFPSAAAALQDVTRDGQMIALGGFGLGGAPEELIDALCATGAQNLTAVCVTGGVDDYALGKLLKTQQVKKLIAAYVGENRILLEQYLAGELKIDFTPMGTVAEKLHAGGCGIPAFYVKAGVGTMVAEGKEVREFDGQTYILERSLIPDIALIRAYMADKAGNLRFRLTSRNLNPAAAMAAKLCIVQAEHVVDTGELAPDDIHLPGIYVHRIVHIHDPQKPIERLTVRD